MEKLAVILCICLQLISACVGIPGEFSFANIYDSNMVLQKAPAQPKIWGYSDEVGKMVVVYFRQKVYAAPARIGEDGNVTWSVHLKASPPGGPFRLTAINNKRRIRLSNVMVGDVWFCSGQSNMVYSVRALAEPDNEFDVAEYYWKVRLFKGEFVTADEPQTDATVSNSWVRPTRENINRFSGICWMFGKKLYQQLKYPVGLIMSAYPATRIEAWSSPAALDQCFPNGIPEWINPEEQAFNEPSVLWNAMVNPFLQLSIQGVIWYQGEWNMYNVEDYSCALTTMLADWRENWYTKSGRTMERNFPFGQVQLAAWRTPEESEGNFSFPAVRWAQTSGLGFTPNENLPNVFTAVAMDLPDFDSPYGSIHPRYKEPIADRLVVGALREAYGLPLIHEGPFPKTIAFNENMTLDVIYDTSTHLEFRNLDNAVAFEVCCSVDFSDCSTQNSTHWFPATVEDTGMSHVALRIPCPTSEEVSVLRYAWRESPCPEERERCAIYGGTGPYSPLSLPAPPFYLERSMWT